VAIREHNGLGDAEIRVVAGARSRDRDHVAFFYRMPRPAIANENARAGQFQVPVGYLAGAILHVDVKMRVRIDPFHLGDDARQVDLLGVIEHRRTGMVG